MSEPSCCYNPITFLLPCQAPFERIYAVAESGKIDNPVDAAFEAWPDKPGDAGEKAKEVALAVGGAIFPPLGVFRILKEQLSIQERFARRRHNHSTFLREYAEWDRSFLCQR